MAILFTDGSKGLFDILGKVFYAQSVLNTASLTTIPTSVAAILAKFNNLASVNLTYERTIQQIPDSTLSWQQCSSILQSTLQQFAADYLVEVVNANRSIVPKNLETALIELIAQMRGAGTLAAPADDVDASTAAITSTPYGSNVGNGLLVVSAKRGDGQNLQNALAESIVATVASTDNETNASISCIGAAEVTDRLSYDWPGGSGIAFTINGSNADNSKLTNGNMDSNDDRSNAPDDWIVAVGTIGTTIKMTLPEVQVITLSGDPSVGTWVINYTNLNSKVQTTAPLDYNATSSQVQSALRTLKGLEAVTVTQSGTAPNLVHTITYLGAGGNQSQVTVTKSAGADGTYTPSTSTGGTPQCYRGSRACWFIGDGSQLTGIQQRVTGLVSQGQYAFCGFFQSDDSPAAGVITVDLYDGSAVISDDYGTANSFTIDCTALTTSFAAKTGSFRLPTNVPPIVYLRIRVSTAITNAKNVFFDEVSFKAMAELYPDGPSVAAFLGNTPFSQGDYFTLAVTNDRAGLFQEYFERNFSMREKGLLLGSDAAAGETIVDTLIA